MTTVSLPSGPSTPCEPVKVPPDISSATIEEYEKKLTGQKQKYEKILSDKQKQTEKFAGALVALFFLFLYYQKLHGTPSIPIPSFGTKTLEELVLDKIMGLTSDISDSSNVSQLEIYISNMVYYEKNFGKYTSKINSPSIVLERFFDETYKITPDTTKMILDFYERNVNPIDQNANIINFFTSRLFLFDHNIDNFKSENARNNYHQRVSCIEEITSRISGRGMEDDILKELLKHEPRDFIFNLIKKYHPRAKLIHPDIAKYVIKAEWVDQLIASGIWSETLSTSYLRMALSHHTNHYVGCIIRKLVEIYPSEKHKKDLSFELIRHYSRSKVTPTDIELNHLFHHLRIINYYFRKEDIKSISCGVNNSGRPVEGLCEQIRQRQQPFSVYYGLRKN